MSDGYSDYLRMRRQGVGRAPYEWQDHVAPEHWGKYIELSAKYRERFVPRQSDADWIALELGDCERRERLTSQGVPIEWDAQMGEEDGSPGLEHNEVEYVRAIGSTLGRLAPVVYDPDSDVVMRD